MPDKTDTEDGRRNDNMQILFSPGCEQPLRDNDFLSSPSVKLQGDYIKRNDLLYKKDFNGFTVQKRPT